jgi:hypothetical protein
MQKTLHTQLTIAAFALVLSAGSAARADLNVESHHHQDAAKIMRQTIEAVDETTQMWIAKDRTAHITSSNSQIVRLDQKKLYLIDHEKKSYSAIPLPLDLSAALGPEMKQAMQAMAGMFKFDVTVTPTSETKTINGFAAKLTKVSISGAMGMKIEQNLWLTKDLDGKMDAVAYKELFGAQMAMLGPMGGDWWKKLATLEGFPVLTESKTTVGGGTMASRDEVKAATEKAPPAGIYDPPAGYKEQPFDPMKQGQR